jgi:hypothetical protein
MHFGDSRILDRIWDKVYPEPNTGCWLWGASGQYGYGQTSDENRKRWRTHRYFLFIETGLEGEHARHLCHTRACVNPDHLAWGNAQDNSDDAKRAGRGYAGRTHCPQGHEYNETNTRIKKRTGQPDRRVCRVCEKAANKPRAHEYRRRIWQTVLEPSDPRHGSHNTYVSFRCRCDLCREAYSVYRRDLPSRQPGYKREEQVDG